MTSTKIKFHEISIFYIPLVLITLFLMLINIKVDINYQSESQSFQTNLSKVSFNAAKAQLFCNGQTCEITSGCFDGGVDFSWCMSVVTPPPPWWCPWCSSGQSCLGGFCNPDP